MASKTALQLRLLRHDYLSYAYTSMKETHGLFRGFLIIASKREGSLNMLFEILMV